MKLFAPSFRLRLFVALLLFLFLKIALEVVRVQDYRGANAHVSFSPDGRYKALRLYIENGKEDAWGEFALRMGGYATYPLFVIADASSDEVLAFYYPPSFWVSDASGGIWVCGEREQGPCTAYHFPYSDEIPVPPPWWKRVHAKLSVKLRGLENAQFKNITVHE